MTIITAAALIVALGYLTVAAVGAAWVAATCAWHGQLPKRATCQLPGRVAVMLVVEPWTAPAVVFVGWWPYYFLRSAGVLP